jgi:hypothetical protein
MNFVSGYSFFSTLLPWLFQNSLQFTRTNQSAKKSTHVAVSYAEVSRLCRKGTNTDHWTGHPFDTWEMEQLKFSWTSCCQWWKLPHRQDQLEGIFYWSTKEKACALINGTKPSTLPGIGGAPYHADQLFSLCKKEASQEASSWEIMPHLSISKKLHS